MKRLSLRMRLTLIVLIVISLMALILTIVAMYNAKKMKTQVAEQIVFIMEVDSEIMGNGPNKGIIFSQEDVPVFRADDINGALIVEKSDDVLKSAISAYSTESVPIPEGTTAIESMIIAFDTMQSRFDYASIIFMLLIIAASGIITYLVLGKGLKPVRQLCNEIEGITENELNVRISTVNSRDEISSLADSFNTLLARLEKAFAEQKSFSTSAAHELKTPLAAIKSNLDVMEMDAAPSAEECTHTLAVVKKQTQRMADLVDDLFAFSSGDYDVADAVDVSEVISGVVKDFALPAKEKCLDISVKSCIETPIQTNASILRRILSNLIGNAVTYSNKNGKIQIAAAEESATYTIIVADNGPGIPDKYTKEIFQPFFRIETSRSRKTGGAGLGLAIAKNMAEKISGTITVSPNTPNGSAFTLRIIK